MTLKAWVELPSEIQKLRGEVQNLRRFLMEELTKLEASVAENKVVIESAVLLIQGIKKALDEAIASNDPAKLAELSTALGEETKKLADAVAANTPVVPPVEPPAEPVQGYGRRFK